MPGEIQSSELSDGICSVLPSEIFLMLFERLDLKSLSVLARVNTTFWIMIRNSCILRSFFQGIAPIKGRTFMYAIQREYRKLMALEKFSLRDYRLLVPFLDHTQIATKLIPLNLSLYYDFSSRVRNSIIVLRSVLLSQIIPQTERVAVDGVVMGRAFIERIADETVLPYFKLMSSDPKEKEFFSNHRELLTLCIQRKVLHGGNFKEYTSGVVRSDVVFMCKVVRIDRDLYQFAQGVAKRSIRLYQCYIDYVEDRHPSLCHGSPNLSTLRRVVGKR